jgi:poly-gamma-glutamate synthesis protein (capsule biosynthesis protein)
MDEIIVCFPRTVQSQALAPLTDNIDPEQEQAMAASIIMLTGDVNLLGVEDVEVPFRKVRATFAKADCVFGNLECCLYDPEIPRGPMMPDLQSGYDGFWAPTRTGQALLHAGFHCVGNANNQNYGHKAIMSSNATLDKLGIPHVGTGRNKAEARKPAVVTRNGKRFGFLQRTCQYWPNHHEATEASPGVATIKVHTAYEPVYYKDGTLPPNRPGLPPKILTWVDPRYMQEFQQDVKDLRAQSDIVVSSHHMGHKGDILDFQSEIAHAAIDSGADVVMAHAEHYPLGIEVYRGKPIFYGLSSFCFIRSNKRFLRGWVGVVPRIDFDDGNQVSRIAFMLVRQADDGEIAFRPVSEEAAALTEIQRYSERFKTVFQPAGDEVVVSAAA